MWQSAGLEDGLLVAILEISFGPEALQPVGRGQWLAADKLVRGQNENIQNATILRLLVAESCRTIK